MDQNPIEDVWYGYHSKFNIKYDLPFYLVVSLNNRGSDGWNPDAGTGYPFSGQAFIYSPQQGSLDPIQATNASGTANVKSSEDSSQIPTYLYSFQSGTVDPAHGSSWYQVQSGTSLSWQIPKNQVPGIFASGINVSGNSIYSTGSNSQFSSFQINGTAGKYQFSLQSGTNINSGVSNVPFSESSWNM